MSDHQVWLKITVNNVTLKLLTLLGIVDFVSTYQKIKALSRIFNP